MPRRPSLPAPLPTSTTSSPPTPPSPLPTFTLYGEAQAGRRSGLGLDPLHCESIAERSARHDWAIAPHRHADLFQLLVLQRGRVQIRAEGREAALVAPAWISVPAPAVHGFAFAPEVLGQVVTVHQAHLQQLLAGEPALRERLLRLDWAPLARRGEPGATALHDAAAQLLARYRHPRPWRRLSLDAGLLQLITAWAELPPGPAQAHDAPAPTGARPGLRTQEHVQRYLALIERDHRHTQRLADYAQALHISPTQLNRCCQQALGRNALALLHERLLLEAQRELSYTTLSIKQIALGLGFTDAAYFSRFFQRLVGCGPAAWRAAGTTRRSGKEPPP